MLLSSILLLIGALFLILSFIKILILDGVKASIFAFIALPLINLAIYPISTFESKESHIGVFFLSQIDFLETMNNLYERVQVDMMTLVLFIVLGTWILLWKKIEERT